MRLRAGRNGMKWGLVLSLLIAAVPRGGKPDREPQVLIKPARVFDGLSDTPHEGWSVLVKGDRIAAVGAIQAPEGARIIELPGATLLPGLIEGHSHLFLHPYNETTWNDQVLKEPL